MGVETGYIAELADRVIEGDRRSIGRAISLCENTDQTDGAHELVAQLWPHTGHAATIGITGPPGVGKSTLTSGLVEHLRAEDQTVGVIAVDPSSSITNGALLGDRIRMGAHYLDPGVFIRSMSARGHLGGVAEATFPAMTVLDAAGKDVVIVETVGVGQSETEVRSLADTVTVVLQPGLGDSIQIIKSGLLEIPDVLCLNKNDQAGADTAKRELRTAFPGDDDSLPLFVETSATENYGLASLWNAIKRHRDILGDEGLRERRQVNLIHAVTTIAMTRLTPIFGEMLQDETGQNLLEKLEARTIDPLSVVDLIIGR